MLLKLAGNMLMDEHIDQRWALHTQWVLDTQNSVRLGQLPPQYPDMPEAPTQATMFEKAQRLETLLFCETVNSQNPASAEPPNSAEAEATTTSAEEEVPSVESAAVQDSVMLKNSSSVVATESENKPEVPNDEDTKNDQPVDFVPAMASTSTEPVQTSTSEPAPLLQRFPNNITNWLWLTKRA